MTGRIKLTFGMLTLALLCSTVIAQEKLDKGNAATEARLKTDIFFLASKECEGRGPTTTGLDKAADYIANKFKEAGLKPVGKAETFFQPFTIPGMVLEGAANLTLNGPGNSILALKQGEEFQPMGLSSGGEVKGAPLVFAGFGIKNEQLKYNDYDNLDVRDKVVIVLRDSPRAGKADAGMWAQVATMTKKIQTAEKEGALAVLLVNDSSTAEDDLIDFKWTSVLRGEPAGKIPAFVVSRGVVGRLLEKTGKTLAEREAEIVKETKPASLELKGWTATGLLPSKKGTIPLKNIIGVVEGHGPLADETIVVGAHYDHLGYGGAGGSLARPKKPIMHNGADDNGSGSTAVLELARRYAAQKDRQGRRIVFMTFSGEELGLLGSDYYCNHPLLPLNKTMAMLNLDMVGRLPRDETTGKDKLLVEANTTAKEWNDLVEKFNEKHGFQLRLDSKGIKGDSDHFSFYRKEVPVLFYWTGIHSDYHRPTDTADKINIEGMRKIVNLADDTIAHLATTDNPPKWQKTNIIGGGGRADGPKLGFIPKYVEGTEGVLIDGIVDGKAADKAGLKKGDVIVELAGQPVKNLQTYMAIMARQKAGQEIDIVILRDDKKQTVKVKPE
jgi:hypothetical protein